MTALWGPANPMWKGDAATDHSGRCRARRLYPDGRPCEKCGKPYGGKGGVARHHVDGNRTNNRPENIEWLCRRHHVAAHRLLDGHVGGGPRPREAAAKRAKAIERARIAADLRSCGASNAEIGVALSLHPDSVRRYFTKYAQALR